MVGNDCCNCSVKNGEMCPRHNIRKSGEWITLCRTDPIYFQAWEGGWGPGQNGTKPLNPKESYSPPKPNRITATERQPPPKLLGDRVEQALTAVGITEERVSRWLGRPCGCARRREKLNRLDAWVRRVLSGETEDAEQQFVEMAERHE